ncbi:streptococcal histidine triad family protein [Streptococcus varani]|uniref:Streptococcal histidine triad family protein n=1 Tax=Streptococcus varani TaxID=1608583 RepID=A0A0E4H6Y8_9STRE|nr:pneumococcal-type histidine triad protein [Streptococcus varani]CQR24121.1 streptococcal histidine triad family protein [Streptococcus varani]
MKKQYIYGSIAALVLSGAAYQLGHYNALKATEDGSIQYVAAGKDDSSKLAKHQEKTPDQISAEEGIDAEQIVVKITDKGYVTSHGDHYHFFNGKVPYDAILSEELIITDPNYVFNEADVINEVEDGYIIKVDGNYYLYLKPGSKRKNIRSKGDIEKQKAKHPVDGHQHKGGDAKNQQMQSGRYKPYTTDDGYVFTVNSIMDDLGDAYLVSHGDHIHYVPKADLNPDELAAAQAYWSARNGGGASSVAGGRGGSSGYSPVSYQPVVNPASGNQGAGTMAEWEVLLRQLYALPLSQRYTEKDGLVFDPIQITRRLRDGVVVPHGDHFHVIPYAKMSDLEVRIAQIIPIGARLSTPVPQPVPAPKPVVTPQPAPTPQPTPTPVPTPQPKKIMLTFQGKTFPAVKKGLDGQPYSTSDGYVFSPDSIYSVDEDGITAIHTNHTHFIPFNELEQSELDQVAQWLAKKHSVVVAPADIEKAISDMEEKAALIENRAVRNRYEDKIALLEDRLFAVTKRSGKEPLSTIAEECKKLAKAIEQELKNPTPKDKPVDTRTAREIYDAVQPALLVPVKDIPYNMDQTVSIKDGNTFVIPHTDHYHNIKMEWFDAGGLYEAPEGYTLEQLFATVKYYLLHPEERPKVDGWGDNSDHGSGHTGGADLPHGVEPAPAKPTEDTDDDDQDADVDTDGDADLDVDVNPTDTGSVTTPKGTDDEVDFHKTQAAKAVEDELWNLYKLADTVKDEELVAGYEEEIEVLFNRFTVLTKTSTSDSLEAIQNDAKNLAKKMEAKG